MSAAKQTVNLPLPPHTHRQAHGVFPKAALLPLALLFHQSWHFNSALHPRRVWSVASSLGQDSPLWVSLYCRLLVPNILIIMHKITAPLPAQMCSGAEAVWFCEATYFSLKLLSSHKQAPFSLSIPGFRLWGCKCPWLWCWNFFPAC